MSTGSSMKSPREDQVKRESDLLGETAMGKDVAQEETGEEDRHGSGLKLRRAITLQLAKTLVLWFWISQINALFLSTHHRNNR